MMRLAVAASILLASFRVEAFAPPSHGNAPTGPLESTVEAEPEIAAPAAGGTVTAEEIQSRLEKQLEKLRQKDTASKSLAKEDLKVVYEDEHIIVVDKPAGVLCVPGKEKNPSLNEAVFDAFGCDMGRMDKMVVHRLGMETSGLVVFARTMEALRGMNTLFRTRKIQRQYEALVCGSVEKDAGIIDLPLMRDYEFPPYMRISTDDHQRALIDLDPEIVGKKLLEAPKASMTKYEVIARESLGEDLPITRVSLTSISGRTHQLNVHCAAFGHAIVGDTTYGLDGEAAPNGGLTDAELDDLIPNANRASNDLQKQIAAATNDKPMCVHAKAISFRHPVTKQDISLSSNAPF